MNQAKPRSAMLALVAMVTMVTMANLSPFGGCQTSFAAGFLKFETIERPTPEFSVDGDTISAKLIPRAKSTSVVIYFKAANGRLDSVAGVDFETIDRPEVDDKNFKSAAFEIKVEGIGPGTSAGILVSSDFFTSSTAFYAFNPNLAMPWMDAKATNSAKADRIRELTITVQDGGPMDADGTADGKITLIGGPRDSFWGYALGTLFIRFFGIFIVLTVLMIGLFVAGLIFNRVGRDGDPKQPVVAEKAGGMVNIGGPADDACAMGIEVTEEEVAAIAAAIFLHHQREYPIAMSDESGLYPRNEGIWAVEGRRRQMADRMRAFRRMPGPAHD